MLIMTVSKSLLALGLLSACCPSHKGIMNFHVDPPLSCPNKPVSIKWEVDGPAVLEACPAPAEWNDQVPAKGELSVALTQTTQFTLIALQGDPAKGGVVGHKTVQITQNKQLGNSAPCDEATRVCSGTFTLKSDGALTAVRLTKPLFVRSGVEQAREVCLTPPNGAKTCVAAGASVNVAVPVDGAWKIEAQLAPDETLKPPPKLEVTFDFGCP
jgi:hypothetical protein